MLYLFNLFGGVFISSSTENKRATKNIYLGLSDKRLAAITSIQRQINRFYKTALI